MVYAGHPVGHRPHPDSARIAAWSATIGLYLAALLLLLRPVGPQIAEVIRHPVVPSIRWIEPQVLPPPPPPMVIPKPKPQVAPPQVRSTPKIDTPPIVDHPPATNEGSQPVVDAPPAPPAVVTAPPSTPAETTLAYLKAPLSFPREALQRHIEGTVLLRVLVDENGKPVDVQIEQSSGQRLLDQSAKSQVMKWLFQPSVVQGQHVKAWARVPVTFALNSI